MEPDVLITHYCAVRDGRRLAYTDCGDPDGTPIVFAHGTPGSRQEGAFFHREAKASGFRVITMDRPGIGGSTFQPARSLPDYASDLTDLADYLGINQFVHMGWSSGGSRTLAAAAFLPDRVRHAVLLSSYTHFSECPESRTLLLHTRWPGPVIANFSRQLFRALVTAMVTLAHHWPATYRRRVQSLTSSDDRRILDDPELTAAFEKDQATCFASGGLAVALDMETEIFEWGFRLADVSRPVSLYQGGADAFLPPYFADHLAARLPQATLNRLPDRGHLYPLDPLFQRDLFRTLTHTLSGGTHDD